MSHILLHQHHSAGSQRTLDVDYALIAAAAKPQREVALGKHKRSVDKHINRLKQAAEMRVADNVFKLKPGVAPNGLAQLILYSSSQPSHLSGAIHGVATAERHVKIVATQYIHYLVVARLRRWPFISSSLISLPPFIFHDCGL